MELALYHPEFGYYARAAQRSGRAGDFFTSVDVGPLFGELLASAARRDGAISVLGSPIRSLRAFRSRRSRRRQRPASADILARCSATRPDVYASHTPAPRRSERRGARRAAGARSATCADRLVSSSATLPESFEGVLVANELLDALPVHQVVMREDGLAARSTSTADGAQLVTREGPLSTPALADYLDRARRHARTGLARRDQPARGRLDPRRGAAADARLHHPDRLRPRGARAVLGDARGRHADDLRAAPSGGRSRAGVPPWLQQPGEQDITAHVDFTSVRAPPKPKA